MRVLIHKNYDAMCRWTSDYIIRLIKKFVPKKGKPFVIGLPTGSSPLGVYKNLVASYKEKKISFTDVISFNMDEYLGLPAIHPESYRKFMDDNFFKAIDIPYKNTHVLDGMTKNPEKECRDYEEAIKASGGIEFFMGGIGGDGHIAFNEPGSSLTSRTRVKTLTLETKIANSRFFGGDINKVPEKALTVGIGTIMDAKEVLILVSGRAKARALQASIEGSVSQWCPLSCLQTHPKSIIVCDEEAAEELRYGTVKYFKDIEKAEIKKYAK